MSKETNKSNAYAYALIDFSLGGLLATFVAISDVKPEHNIILPEKMPTSKYFTFVSYSEQNIKDTYVLKNNQWVKSTLPSQYIFTSTKNKNHYGLRPAKSGQVIKGMIFGEELHNFAYKYILIGKGVKSLDYKIK
jgi:hypothetical protein